MAINNKWAERQIGEDCFVGDGAHAKIPRQNAGIMYLTSKNFKSDGLDLTKIDYISEDYFKKYFKDNSKASKKPIAEDVLFSIIGTIGEPYLVKEQDYFGISSSVAILRPNKSVLFPKYLYYWIKGHILQSALYGIKSGVAQGFVSLEMIKSLPLWYPTLPTQRKIAAILSAYDDLIENNMRRIKILEEMAQALYREWFVKFRFPGHEKVGMVESELGMVPEGWKIKKLGDVVKNIRISVKPGSKTLDLPYVPIDCLPRKSLALTESKSGSEAQSSLFSFKKYDILFGAMRSYFHKVVIAPFDGTTRSTCFVLRPTEEINYSYAVLTLFEESTVAYSSKHSRGTTIPYAVWDGALENMPIIMPPEELRSKINRIVKPILERIAISLFRQANLRRTRDLLLPKLISGEVDVENIEVQTPDNGSCTA